MTEAEANQNGYETTVTGAQGNIIENATAQAMFTNEKKDGGGGGVSDLTGSLSITQNRYRRGGSRKSLDLFGDFERQERC